jgi:hypothetical protein
VKRRLFNLLAALSLVLCVASLISCAGSYHRAYSIRYAAPSATLLCVLDKGLIQIDLVHGDTKERGLEWNDYDREVSWGRKELNFYGPPTILTRLGFGAWRYRLHVGSLRFLRANKVFIPVWCLGAMTILSPAIWTYWVVRRARRLRTNHCLKCGYDLRASNERCPECGTAIAAGGGEAK